MTELLIEGINKNSVIRRRKRARGMMANYVIKNKIRDYAEVSEFSEDGYNYSKKLSTSSRPVFIK